MASQPRGTEKDVDEEEEKAELRMPRSFDCGDHGSGVAREAGTVDPFDAVEMLWNLWRWTQLR